MMNTRLKNIGKFSLAVPVLLCSFLILTGCVSKTAEQESEKAVVKTMYSPPSNAPAVGAMYPRVLEIKHHKGSEGDLLATFEHYMHREPSFPIYCSTDSKENWHLYSEVEDTHNSGFPLVV